MNWYAMFVKSKKEENIMKYFKKVNFMKDLSVFIPQVKKIYKSSKIQKIEIFPIFPGYIFFESDISDIKIRNSITAFTKMFNDAYRLLNYGTPDYIKITNREKYELQALGGKQHCVDISKGIKIGTNIKIISGPLMGRESSIKYIDRHKRRATIELEFLGQLRNVEVGLELLKTVTEF